MTEDNTKQEHKRLAGVVKGLHANLRKKLRSNDGDYHEVWESHCQNKELLAEYADAMHHLAVDHWNLKPETRIHWCYETVMEYFHHGGLQKIFTKEQRSNSFKKPAPSRTTSVYTSKSVASSDTDSWNVVDVFDKSIPTNAVTFNSVEFYDSSWEEISIIPCDAYNCLNNETQDKNLASPNVGEAFDHQTVDAKNETKPSDTSGVQQSDLGSELEPAAVSSVDAPPSGNISSITSEDTSLEDCVVNVNADPDNIDGAVDIGYGQTPNDASSSTQDQQQPASCPLYNHISLPFKDKIRLLDVGSCYNPFLQFEEFQAVGIDISPAKPSVYRCDFLNLETSEPLQLAPDTLDTYISGLKDPIEKLPRDIFHVVVFSLLLEYFPSPYQRWMCCQKARELLVLNGLLIIITPDSHGQHRNAPMIRSWKMAIESMGFKRWKYVKKEHIHCLAFRKIEQPVKVDCLISEVTPDFMYIPQDFNYADSIDANKSYVPLSVEDEEFFRATMQELPVCPSDDESTATSEEFIL